MLARQPYDETQAPAPPAEQASRAGEKQLEPLEHGEPLREVVVGVQDDCESLPRREAPMDECDDVALAAVVQRLCYEHAPAEAADDAKYALALVSAAQR